jgi:hypothetical protein
MRPPKVATRRGSGRERRPERLRPADAWERTGPAGATTPPARRSSACTAVEEDDRSNSALAEGMVVYRTIVQKPGRSKLVDHLNPQTMD